LFDPVPRERLFHRLDELRRLPLVWIGGPPGCGKTSLTSSWLDARKLPFIWYQVDSGDTEPATVFAFLVEAARTTSSRAKPLPYLAPNYSSALQPFARRFFRQLFSSLPAKSVLVFDNCQEAAQPAFHVLLEVAASQLIEGMTLIAISRMQVPPELARLQANRTIGTLAWDDLRLTSDEARSILQRSDQTDPAATERVVSLAGGWAAGLVLLSAGAGRVSHESRVDLRTREALFAYFAGEFFDTFTQAEREMLMSTALLPEVSARAATELSGDPQAGSLLERLYRGQYFTERRTEPELRYHYHDLFRSFLIARAEQTLSATTWTTIILRAARQLEANDLFDPAVELYQRCSAWNDAERVILLRAEEWMRQGRWQTLQHAVHSLPPAQVEREPWLLYWSGMAEQVTDVLRARAVFEKAVRLFAERGQALGEALAVSAVVDGYFQEWNTIVTLDPWLDSLLRLCTVPNALPERGLLRARTSLLVGLLFRRPSDPALRECVAAVTAGYALEADPSERLRMIVYLIVYSDLMGHFAVVRDLIAQSSGAVVSDEIAPRLRVWAIFRFAHHYMNAGEDERALGEVRRALAMAHTEGVETLSGFLLIGHAMVLLNAGQASTAEDVLKQASPLLKPTRPMELVFYKWAEFSIALALNNFAQANALWDAFAQMPLIGVAHNTPYNLGTILLLVRRGAIGDAQARVDRWRDTLAGMRSACLDYNLHIMQAYIDLHRDPAAAAGTLRAAFASAAANSFYGTLCWLPEVMRPLCALAIREGIEPDFVTRLIRKKRLRPGDERVHWVWPVKVYTLGRFAVLRNGEAIRFAHRPQHKPLELLQAIIAAGEGGLTTRQLTSRLWPDAEGDAANNSMNAALHRLRKLLGDEASVLVNNGRVFINSDVCWVDALTFDSAATEALSETRRRPDSERIAQLYCGHFLGEDVDSAWAVAFRDRLRAKFLRLTLLTGQALEAQGRWARAADLYRRFLEIDNVQEEPYRRLMLCLREVGETAQAIEVYRRCREMLSMILGVSPSPETTALFRTLQQ
jgi:ATP/maltotriose-dependent transcriptional regulator MalT/DNA-binding SARP family transcriptional activator